MADHMLSKRYELLYRSEKYYDCVFHMGDGNRIKCHKLILSSSSPVFEAMFYGPLKEAQSEIEILDISAEVFRMFAKYIYAGEVDFQSLTLEQSIEMYYAAEKYLIGELSAESLRAIGLKLRFSNILPALELSVCMDLSALRNTCLNFFVRTCLGDTQYKNYLKGDYVHVSKECIKAIIAAGKHSQGDASCVHNLMWFVKEWCCQEDGEHHEELQHEMMLDEDCLQMQLPRMQPSITLERIFYKACRPFEVEEVDRQWRFALKSNRFINLVGLILNSRICPNRMYTPHFPREYEENIKIEIRETTEAASKFGRPITEEESSEDSGEDSEDSDVITVSKEDAVESPFSWHHSVYMANANYNSDLNIKWSEGIILSPDKFYEVRLKWSKNAFGAEYPCSLQSNCVDGIQFLEPAEAAYSGSLIKGLRIENLF